MKIVHVTDWYVPNMGYQENFLPAEQARLGHEVTIITSGKIPPYGSFVQSVGSQYPNRLIGLGVTEENGVRIYRLPSIEMHEQPILIGLIDRLKKIGPDILHLHGTYSPSTSRVLLSKSIDCKIFVDDHSHETNFHTDSIPARLYLAAVKAIYALSGGKVSQFLPITYSASKILRETLKIGDDQITLLPLGANLCPPILSKDERDRLRYQLGVGESDVLIMTSGKFSRSKDLHILIEAFSLAASRNARLLLLLVGNGPNDYMKEIMTLIEESGCDDKVIFKDFVPNAELTKLMAVADIGVWPGDPSISVIEAVACGLPVIVPLNDQAYKIVLDNGAGTGFARKNPSALSSSICALADSEQYRLDMSRRASSLARDVLSWQRIAKQSLEVYEEASNSVR